MEMIKIVFPSTIPCPFLVGWVKRQRNPTHLLGFMLIAPRSRSVPQGYVHVTQPNLQIKAFSNLDKVLLKALKNPA
jgi:hypothetical protein